MWFAAVLASRFSILVLVALSALALPCRAELSCSSPGPAGASQCHAGLTADSVRRIIASQERQQWCWAASIAMVFAYYGFQIRQDDIVTARFGAADDRPADSGEAMTSALSRQWADGQDRQFVASARAADALARRFELTAENVATELSEGRPMLVGALGHAMVLVGIRFDLSATGKVRIHAATVIDPAPGQGLRQLAGAELRPTYLAAVMLRRVADSPAQP